jgi:hypothetical protein
MGKVLVIFVAFSVMIFVVDAGAGSFSGAIGEIMMIF